MEGDKESGKKRKGSSENITLEELKGLFHLPIKDAASAIGIGATVFKQVCRKHNISKWPYRQLHALNDSLEKIEKAAAGRTMDANERESHRLMVRELKEGIDKVMEEVTQPTTSSSSGGGSGGGGSSSSSEPSLKAKNSNKRAISGVQGVPPSSSSKSTQDNDDGNDDDDNHDGGGVDGKSAADKGDENDKQTGNIKAASGGVMARKEKKVRVTTAVSNLSISAKGLAKNLATGNISATRRHIAPPAPPTTGSSTGAYAFGASKEGPLTSSSASSRLKSAVDSRLNFHYDPSSNGMSTGRNHLRRGWFKDEADQLVIEDEVIDRVGHVKVQTEVLKDYFPELRAGKGKSKGGSAVPEPRELVTHVPGGVELPPLQCMLASLQSKGTLILTEPRINAEEDVKALQLVPSFAVSTLLEP